jgi:hypothetical protein
MTEKLRLKTREILLKVLNPLVKIIGKIKSPFVKEKMALSYTPEILDTLQPLDIILSKSLGHLSNVFNPGKWKHAIIYLGIENGIPMIAEAIGRGVIKRNLYECLADKNFIAICRTKEKLTKTAITKGVDFANAQVGKGYDYDFDMFSGHKYQNFFCSELAYYTLKEAIPNLKFKLMKSLGVETVSPNDFYQADKHFDVVFETK